MADSSTTPERIPILFPGRCWARCQLHNGRRYVSMAWKLRRSLSSMEGVLESTLAEFHSMANCSTTTGHIPILLPGGCWARRQLHNSIRYVPTPSKTHEVVVFCGGTTQAEFYSIPDSSTTTGHILILFPRGCWACHQLCKGRRYVPTPSNP